MTIDERRRLALHEAARGTWGAEVAATFLEMLPPAGWGDVATRQQLVALEDRLLARMEAGEARLLARIDAGEQRLRLEITTSMLRAQRWTFATILTSSALVVAAVAVIVR